MEQQQYDRERPRYEGGPLQTGLAANTSGKPEPVLTLEQTETLALRIDLASARRINDTQRREIERLQADNRRLREHRGGWGDR